MYRPRQCIRLCACPVSCNPGLGGGNCGEAKAQCDLTTQCTNGFRKPDPGLYDTCWSVTNPRKKRDLSNTTLDDYIKAATRPSFSQQQVVQRPNVRLLILS